MARVLLIGANSYIGKRLLPALARHDITATYHTRPNSEFKQQEALDLTNKESVQEVVKRIRPEIIILAAAISTNKSEPALIQQTNIDGVQHVADAVRASAPDTRVILFSTEQVFSGAKESYAETDTPDPINEYGRSKAEAEKIVQQLTRYLILRLAAVQGPILEGEHDNFLSLFLSDKELTVFDDVYRAPIYVEDVISIIASLIDKKREGILHLAGDDFLSYAAMAEQIEAVYQTGREFSVAPCHLAEVPRRLHLGNAKLKKLGFSLTAYADLVQQTHAQRA